MYFFQACTHRRQKLSVYRSRIIELLFTRALCHGLCEHMYVCAHTNALDMTCTHTHRKRETERNVCSIHTTHHARTSLLSCGGE